VQKWCAAWYIRPAYLSAEAGKIMFMPGILGIHIFLVRQPERSNPRECGVWRKERSEPQSLHHDNDSNPSGVYQYNMAMAACIADPGLHDHLSLSLFHCHYSLLKAVSRVLPNKMGPSPILLESRQQTGLSLRFIVVFANLLFTSYLATLPRSDPYSWQSTYRPVSIS
jgi:hypothetical protein